MPQPHVLLIDNYDSFTYNLVHYLEALDAKVSVVKNDARISNIKKINFSHILLSPGPGQVTDAGVSMDVIDKFHALYPIFGVCMGHQCLAEYFGAKIVRAQRIMHGKVSKVKNLGKAGLQLQLPEYIKVMRYHSWVVSKIRLPDALIATALTADLDEEIMAVAHANLPIYGVQYHPESVLSEYGHKVLNNFLDI